MQHVRDAFLMRIPIINNNGMLYPLVVHPYILLLIVLGGIVV